MLKTYKCGRWAFPSVVWEVDIATKGQFGSTYCKHFPCIYPLIQKQCLCSPYLYKYLHRYISIRVFIICNTKKLEAILMSDKGRLNYRGHTLEHYTKPLKGMTGLCADKEKCLYYIISEKKMYRRIYLVWPLFFVKIPSILHNHKLSRDPVHLYIRIEKSV